MELIKCLSYIDNLEEDRFLKEVSIPIATELMEFSHLMCSGVAFLDDDEKKTLCNAIISAKIPLEYPVSDKELQDICYTIANRAIALR